MELRMREERRIPISFSMALPRGFNLQKKVRDWKWTVAVLHELLYFYYLGFRNRFRKAVVHHSGIFHMSKKMRAQTVGFEEVISNSCFH
ncbi:hypothetical protein DCAR_0103954 [Daucus carota subsp. sativus]|uniref:Uncharacterized protein n=1 Tax=Daucus carota subsp. sativus TaxID=79200 RepID=A0AAF0W7T6_DAUCS|nr:hypothetical protein DCAR_0103954 [Daucus carota subsp. sativus]